MPNYKIFQDVAENLRAKIYASQSGTATALQMDSGALVVKPVAESSGVGVPLQMSSGGLVVKPYVLESGTMVAMQADSGALATALYAKQSGALTSLQMASGALVVTTDIITMDSGTTATFASDTNSGTTIWNVMEYKDWTYAINKVSGSGTTQVKLEISATGSGNDWNDENGTFATIASGDWQYFVSTTFLKYARIAVAVSGGTDSTVHWYFQGQKG